MKRIEMKRNIRLGAAAALVVLLLLCAGMAAWWFRQPLEAEEVVQVYACQQEAGVNYQVYFEPNRFFPDESAGPERAYFTPLTDYIDTDFQYRFSGDAPADISGEYQVVASLTGYILKQKEGAQGFERERVKVWEKTDVLVRPTAFSGTESTLEVEQEVQVDLPKYVDFVEDLREEFRYTAEEIDLNVVYHVSTRAVTSEGEFSEELAPVLVIPIEGSAFTVEGRHTDLKEHNVTETREAEVPGVQTARNAYTAAAGVFALLLLGIFLGTAVRIEDPAEKELRAIMKKHGDWIAAGTGRVPAVSPEKTLVMETFEDLLKVADEVGQPVLYEDLNTGTHSFYVIADPLVYSYTLEETETSKTAGEKTESKDKSVDKSSIDA